MQQKSGENWFGFARRTRVTVRAAVRTDVGLVRSHNEDTPVFADLASGNRDPKKVRQVGLAGILLGVCDGMGGAAAGEVASRIAAQAVAARLSKTSTKATRDEFAAAVVRAIEGAGREIRHDAKQHPRRRGMGTTCTAVAYRRGELVIGQVGDSRAYVYRLGRLVQVTQDQNLVTHMVELGTITPEEAKHAPGANVVMQALGSTKEIEVVLSSVSLRRGDRVLVCSDGLCGLVSDDMIRVALALHTDPEEACDRLVALARDAGGRDNITTVLCDLDGEDLSAPTADDILAYQPYVAPEPTTGTAAVLASVAREERVRLPSAYGAHHIVLAVLALGLLVALTYRGARSSAAPSNVVRRDEHAAKPTPATPEPVPPQEAPQEAHPSSATGSETVLVVPLPHSTTADVPVAERKASSPPRPREAGSPKPKAWNGPASRQFDPYSGKATTGP